MAVRGRAGTGSSPAGARHVDNGAEPDPLALLFLIREWKLYEMRTRRAMQDYWRRSGNFPIDVEAKQAARAAQSKQKRLESNRERNRARRADPDYRRTENERRKRRQ